MRGLRSLIQRLGGSKPTKESTAYWKERAALLGRRAVLNVGHPESAFDEVTRKQERELLPHLMSQLTGTERVALDFGCGPGRFTIQVAEAIRGRAIGVDPVPGLLELAPTHADVEYRVLENGTIPAADRSIDVVWCCLVLGGLAGPTLANAVNELERVSTDNALLFLVENTSVRPDGPTWNFRSIEEYQRLVPWAQLRHLHDYTDLGETISVMGGRVRAAGVSARDQRPS